jgi:phosphoglycerol transferase MdoB-like AlkP superfamily enzyme
MEEQTIINRRRPSFVPSEISYLAGLFTAWLSIFSLLRLGLLLRNINLAEGIPLKILSQSFLVGVRFDIAVTCYLLFPLLAWGLIPKYGWQYQARVLRFFPWALSVLWSPLIFLSMAEWEFYREFQDRFNLLAVQYIREDPGTVVSMIWHGYPVVRYLLLWTVFTALFFSAMKFLSNRSALPAEFSRERYLRRTLPAALVFLLLFVAGVRGGVQRGAPLRWGDAYFSKYTYANHLALNGMYMLSRTVIEQAKNRKQYWLTRLPDNKALEEARTMVLQEGDRLVDEKTYPLFRTPGTQGSSIEFRAKPRNIVIILMESLSAEFVGALGASYHATPNLDQLVRKGILFERFFSQGTHTHQGLFATIVSFPHLPDFEYLMKTSPGQQKFRSFITLLHEKGHESMYIYNGSFTWDNQEGFFRNQGMKHFIGRDDFVNPKFMDPTWGVSDEDVFLRGIEEISQATVKTPVFALLQTLSNHAPFDLPKPAPFNDVKGPDHLIPRLNGIRYADWALGKFMELAAKKPWFSETLFVIVGDHGFAFEESKAMMDLSVYHVPLLLYYPGDTRFAGKRIKTVGSQVDILPTVMGLAGISSPHQAWGRDLFRLRDGDEGWAVVKPSGNTQLVGFISGDRLLVLTPKLRPVMYQYGLNPWDAKQITAAPEELARLSGNAYGYVQTALSALLTNRAGVTGK